MPAISRENEAKLSAKDVHAVLDYSPETGEFRWKITLGPNAKAGGLAGTVGPDGRRRIKIGDTRYLASRLAWLYVNGHWPKLYIDHIDRNCANDAFSNLRDADGRQNHWNSGLRKDNGLGLRNITKHRKRFAVRFFQDKRALYRESFASIEDAMRARDAQYALIYGAFTPTHPDTRT